MLQWLHGQSRMVKKGQIALYKTVCLTSRPTLHQAGMRHQCLIHGSNYRSCVPGICLEFQTISLQSGPACKISRLKKYPSAKIIDTFLREEAKMQSPQNFLIYANAFFWAASYQNTQIWAKKAVFWSTSPPHSAVCWGQPAAILGHEGNHTLQSPAAAHLMKKKLTRKLLSTSKNVNFLLTELK